MFFSLISRDRCHGPEYRERLHGKTFFAILSILGDR
jgi:hypothetical protein